MNTNTHAFCTVLVERYNPFFSVASLQLIQRVKKVGSHETQCKCTNYTAVYTYIILRHVTARRSSLVLNQHQFKTYDIVLEWFAMDTLWLASGSNVTEMVK